MLNLDLHTHVLRYRRSEKTLTVTVYIFFVFLMPYIKLEASKMSAVFVNVFSPPRQRQRSGYHQRYASARKSRSALSVVGVLIMCF